MFDWILNTPVQKPILIADVLYNSLSEKFRKSSQENTCKGVLFLVRLLSIETPQGDCFFVEKRVLLLRYILLLYSNIKPAGIYLLKVNNRITRSRYQICSKLTINGVVLVSLLLTLNIFHTLF